MKLLEWLRTRFQPAPHVGPACNPPAWVVEQAREFVRLYPGAVVRDWMRFSISQSLRAYEAGYRDGWERALYPEPPPTTPPADPEPLLEGLELDRVVPIQGPAAVSTVFVDARGTAIDD